MRGPLAHFTARRLLAVGLAATASGLGLGLAGLAPVQAAEAAVEVATAAPFGVLGATTVTNTGPTTIDGDVGLYSGTAITGFPPGVITGAFHTTDAVAATAQDDTTIAYNDAAGRATTANVTAALGAGQTLTPGVYTASTSMAVDGALNLDAVGDPAAVFIFQAGSTLTTASASSINLLNGAHACNVFWQVGSSATLGTASTFVGTILADASITATTSARIQGRLLARTGAVTLDTNEITVPLCAATTAGSTPTTVLTTTAAPTDAGTPASTATASSLPATTATTARPAIAAPPSGATSPPLASTGTAPDVAMPLVSFALILTGLIVTWFARPPLAHGVRNRRTTRRR